MHREQIHQVQISLRYPSIRDNSLDYVIRELRIRRGSVVTEVEISAVYFLNVTLKLGKLTKVWNLSSFKFIFYKMVILKYVTVIR